MNFSDRRMSRHRPKRPAHGRKRVRPVGCSRDETRQKDHVAVPFGQRIQDTRRLFGRLRGQCAVPGRVTVRQLHAPLEADGRHSVGTAAAHTGSRECAGSIRGRRRVREAGRGSRGHQGRFDGSCVGEIHIHDSRIVRNGGRTTSTGTTPAQISRTTSAGCPTAVPSFTGPVAP